MVEDWNRDLASEFDDDFEGELPETVDRAAVERMRFVAHVLDESIPIPGTGYRVGLDPLVGAIPGAGDAITGFVSIYIVLESARLGVSFQTLLVMLGNVTVDVAGGSVPYLGSLFDAAWKSNKRNLELALEDLATGTPAASDEDVTHIEVE